ncbi:MAG: helix-turn-helix transcriptional regulator [Opitutaceae bacterium]|jgi:AraC family transcriptional regulator|nr:helix-turn-helix transcriptional regulator [Opitutaceae bacterium]
MLRYFANGVIRWKNAMLCNTRTNWEFYAVVKGRCAAVLKDGEKPELKERTLWIFPPECSHAWADDGRRAFHRIAFHFGSVPYPLDEIVREKGWFSKRLTDEDVARLTAIAAEVEPHFRQPSLLSPLVFQGRLMDLCALALSDQTTSLPPALPDLAHFKVERASTWYAEHLARNPSVKEAADAVHVSPSHLRRLFWQVRKHSPKTAFQRIRLEKANSLMSRSALTLEDVARHCGFASASHFCREYKRVHHFTPTHWRKRLVAGFSKPLPPGVVPVREFSARPEERTMSA